MEHASGESLMPMANLWLRRSGHPHILYSGSYDSAARTYTVSMEQTQLPAADPQPWILPVDWALVKDGAVTHTGVHRLSAAKDTLVIRDVETEPDFLSFARGWSFFGTHANTKASGTQLSRQALTDPDCVNRYFAYRAVVDAEKAAIIEALRTERAVGGQPEQRPEGGAPGVTVSPELVQLHAAILFDEQMTAGARASLLREGEDIHTRKDLSFLYVSQCSEHAGNRSQTQPAAPPPPPPASRADRRPACGHSDAHSRCCISFLISFACPR